MRETIHLPGPAAHPIRKNTFLSLLIAGMGYLYPVIVFVYIARILHPEGLGSASFASSVASIFMIFTGLGMPLYGLRSVAEKRERSLRELGELAVELMVVRVLSGILAWAAFFVFTRFFAWSNGALLTIYGFGILIAILDCSWLYKGMEDYSSLAWISAVAKLCGLAALFLLVRESSDILKYAWIAISIPLVENVIGLVWAERKWKIKIGKNLRRIVFSHKALEAVRRHVRPLGYFLLMHCAVTVYTHTDTVMLGMMEGDRAVGLYSCAAKIKVLLTVLTGTIYTVALPKATELWKKKKESEFRELSRKSFHVVYMVLLPLTVYFIIFSKPWILLVGGSEYAEAAWTMQILLLAVIPIGLSNIVGGQMLIPMGMEKKLFQAELIGAISNIFLNAILIPRFSASGAAVATTISEVLVTVVVMYAVLKQVNVRMLRGRRILQSVCGCAVAGGISYGLCTLLLWPGPVNAPVSLAVFGLCFGLVMLLFRDPLYREALSVVKKFYRKLVPDPVRKGIRATVRKGRETGYRTIAVLFPKRMKLDCPCCENRFRAFGSGEYMEHPEVYNPVRYKNIRQDVLCPVCGALPRHRILASWCNDHLALLQSSEILYFAPEYCMLRWMKRNGVSCTTADLFQEADLKLDIQATGLTDGSWDMVFCNHVLEHVEDFRTALKEMYRILRPEGHLICSFPMDPKVELLDEAEGELSEEERIRRFGQCDHLRVFGMKAAKFLEEAGFVVEKISGEVYPVRILPVVGPADYDMNCLFDCRKAENPIAGKSPEPQLP